MTESLKGISPPFLILAALMCLLPSFFNAIRVYIWARFFNKPLKILECLRLVMICDIGAAASPTASGGGPFKAALLVEHGFNTSQAVSLMFLGTLEDGLFFLIAIPVTLFFSRESHSIGGMISLPLISQPIKYIASFILLVLAVIVMGITFVPRIYHRIKTWGLKVKSFINKVGNCFRLIAGPGRNRFFITMPLTALQWTSRYTAIVVILAGFGISIDPNTAFIFQWTTFTIMNLIPTPGAAGGAEASFYALHHNLIPAQLAVLAAVSWRVITFYVPVGFASLFILVMHAKNILSFKAQPMVQKA